MVDGDLVVFESAAICLHVCEKSDGGQLIPVLGSPARPSFFQWLFYLTTTVQSELMIYFYPDKHTSPGSSLSVVEAQELRITGMFQLLDQQLGDRPFLVGDTITVCDCFLFMLSVWADELRKPPMSFANLARYLTALACRPAFRRVCEKEGVDLSSYEIPVSNGRV